MAAFSVCLSCHIAWSEPGDGLRLPPFTLRPTVEGALTWDSNVWMANDKTTKPSVGTNAVPAARNATSASGRSNEVSDVFYTAGLSLSAMTRSDALRTSIDAWGRTQRYQDTGARDSNEYGERLQLGFGERRSLDVSIYERFSSVDQYDRGPIGRDLQNPGNPVASSSGSSLNDPTLQELVALSKRTTLDLDADFGRDLTEKLTGDLQYLFSTTSYDRSNADIVTNAATVVDYYVALNNMSEQRLSGELGWKATEKTALTLTGEGAIQDSDGFENPATLLAARIGAASRTTGKMQFRAGVGIMQYAYDSYGTNTSPFRVDPVTGDRERIPAESTTRVEPDFELGAEWTPSSRWQIQASSSSTFLPAAQYAGNAVFSTTYLLQIRYRMFRDLSASVVGGIQRNEYLEPVLIADPAAEGKRQAIDKTVDLYSISARLDFRPSDSFWSAYAEARQNDSTSNDPSVEYAVTQVSAGVSAWY